METGSEWSHILGEAKAGTYMGTTLEQIPAVMTDWETWSAKHPNGTVAMMSRSAQQFNRGMMGQRKKFVLGIVWEAKPYAWSFDKLADEPVWQTKVGDTLAVLFFDSKTGTGRLYQRRTDKIKDQVLAFSLEDGKIVNTGPKKSEWDVSTGKAVSGPWEGQSLVPLPGIVSFRHTWRTFHPETKWDPK